MAGYEERRAAFLAEGVSIIAGTVDSQEQTAEVARDLGFPVAYGMTRADGDALGSSSVNKHVEEMLTLTSQIVQENTL